MDDLTPLQRLIAEMRSRLRPGGPPVDRAAVRAYLAGALVEDERRLVSERIETWWGWFDAWRELLPATDPEPEDGASVLPLAGSEKRRVPFAATSGIPATMSDVRLSPPDPDPVSIALRVLAALAPAIGSVLAVAARSDTPEDTTTGDDAVRARLAEGRTVAVSSETGWVSGSVRGDTVRLKIRRSPAEPYPPFRIQFCRGSAVVLDIVAEGDTVVLKPEDYAALGGVDGLRVTPA